MENKHTASDVNLRDKKLFQKIDMHQSQVFFSKRKYTGMLSGIILCFHLYKFVNKYSIYKYYFKKTYKQACH